MMPVKFKIVMKYVIFLLSSFCIIPNSFGQKQKTVELLLGRGFFQQDTVCIISIIDSEEGIREDTALFLQNVHTNLITGFAGGAIYKYTPDPKSKLYFQLLINDIYVTSLRFDNLKNNAEILIDKESEPWLLIFKRCRLSRMRSARSRR